jgi:hypothetical protein
MLRSAYFEDWKDGRPSVLLWGDAAGMAELRDFLRSFANVPTLGGFCRAIDRRIINITVAATQDDAGMCLAGECLEWRLLPALADCYAEKVAALVPSTSGHQYLETDGSDITVEVSIGEYPEDLHP